MCREESGEGEVEVLASFEDGGLDVRGQEGETAKVAVVGTVWRAGQGETLGPTEGHSRVFGEVTMSRLQRPDQGGVRVGLPGPGVTPQAQLHGRWMDLPP